MHHYHDVHPQDLSHLDSAQLRARFLIPHLFQVGTQKLSYWDVDRTVVGGGGAGGDGYQTGNARQFGGR